MLVYLVDDHEIVRGGLKSLLKDYYKDDIQFKEASNADEVINIDNKDAVDLILLDLFMEGTKGLEALVKVKQHYQCSIVILSGAEEPQLIRDAIEQGAVGFIPKSSSIDIYVPALKLVIAGGIYLPPHVLDDYDESEKEDINPASEDLEKISHLTGRKLDALIKASEGKSNKVIASEMEIEIGTVKAYLAECNKLLGVHNRTAAAKALFDLLGVNNRADAIYAIASKASFDGQLEL